MAKSTLNSKLALKRIEKIQELLRKNELSANEIADGIFMCVRWARKYVSHSHKNKLIYISSYKRFMLNGKSSVRAMYSWGNKPDAVKPPALTDREKSQRTRDLIKDDVDRHERLLALRRNKRIVLSPDWTSSWIPRRNSQQNIESV